MDIGDASSRAVSFLSIANFVLEYESRAWHTYYLQAIAYVLLGGPRLVDPLGVETVLESKKDVRPCAANQVRSPHLVPSPARPSGPDTR